MGGLDCFSSTRRDKARRMWEVFLRDLLKKVRALSLSRIDNDSFDFGPRYGKAGGHNPQGSAANYRKETVAEGR